MPKKTTKKNGSGNFVINPLKQSELQKFLDDKSKKIIKYFIIKSLFSQPEPKKGQKTLPIQIPKEHIEQWFTQSLDVKPVGAGSCPIDIYNEREKWGADIKMLNVKLDRSGNITNSDSGEASLGQKFEGPGINLDELFRAHEYEEIKDQWLELYYKKYKSLNKNYYIKKIYYFFILRPGTQIEGANFFFAGAVINLNALKKVGVNGDRTTTKSVFLKNFIDGEYGNTKIYKAKKRLELRLHPKTWVDNDMALKITTSFIPTHINLREEKVDAEYLKKEIDKLNNIEVQFIE